MSTVPAPAVQPSGSSLATSWNNCTTSFQEKHNSLVTWLANNSFKKVEVLSLKLTGTDADPADGTMKKVGKVFGLFLALITLVLPAVALVGCAYSWAKNLICGSKAVTNQPAAPPTPVTAVANTAIAAGQVAPTTPVAAAAIVTPVAQQPAPVVNQPAANPAPVINQPAANPVAAAVVNVPVNENAGANAAPVQGPAAIIPAGIVGNAVAAINANDPANNAAPVNNEAPAVLAAVIVPNNDAPHANGEPVAINAGDVNPPVPGV